MEDIKFPKDRSTEYLKKYFRKKKLNLIVENIVTKKPPINQLKFDKPYPPDLQDLYRLYEIIRLNKRITALEFGSGWSTLIISLALNENRKNFYKETKQLRRNNVFEMFSIDNELKYLNITKKRISSFKKNINNNLSKINFSYSEVEMTTYNNKICTQYKKLPLCNPDFIYLDGPDCFSVKKDINGISTRHKDMMPMVSDILKFEYFYLPGTIIVVDGRGANCRFLKDNFSRNWKYTYQRKYDQHFFYLDEPPLGEYNRSQIKFYQK